MPRLQSLKSTARGAWHEYGGWIVLLFAAYALWAFRKVFTGLGDAAGDTVAGAVANVQAQAQVKVDRAKAQAATGSKTTYTDVQLAQFRADATEIAGLLGTMPGLSWNGLVPKQAEVVSKLKQTYSRLLLLNNKPYYFTGPAGKDGKRPYKNVDKETAACVKRNAAFNYHVLDAAYKDVTGGNNLASDVRSKIKDFRYTGLIPWIL